MSSTKSNNEEISKISLFHITSASFFAVILRYCLMISKYQTVIANHIEVSTPLNSWKRVSEGLYLLSNNINPYNGDLLHETPFSLYIYKNILLLFQGRTDLMFITFDIITGWILYLVTRLYVNELYKNEEVTRKTYAKDAVDNLLKPDKVLMFPYYALLSFLFNPFTLLSCAGHSTTVFHNLFLSLLLLSMVQGIPIVCGIFLALCSSVSFYPVVLVIPVFLYFSNVHNSTFKALFTVKIFLLSAFLIVAFCTDLLQDFGYLKNVYGCILTVPDLQPNIGLFWYFFTEMFDHFRELFIFAFQINASVLYLVPLSIKFRKQPFLLTVAVLFLISIFKSYPSIGDVGFVFSLLPCFTHLFKYSQQGFLVGVILLVSTSLAPIVWYLWIYCNSANANFYFGVTLAFAIAQIFLLTDLLFAQVKREFILKHGKDRTVDGEDGILCLE
ncbi:phosphatidylinositol glycan anchor biosynthesis class U [Leptinotarsa decemlineata]|uniref:phosphatidylinositol glycan anchor biosynthesis class U n=1 Tax=Leptinotarsa decemlineata TaxID=7539 RepID=UPI000C2531B7|nr:phosphatidylinositol glycan anchor biosynthesis class U protein [Leptinotarsa decemlineata]